MKKNIILSLIALLLTSSTFCTKNSTLRKRKTACTKQQQPSAARQILREIPQVAGQAAKACGQYAQEHRCCACLVCMCCCLKGVELFFSAA